MYRPEEIYIPDSFELGAEDWAVMEWEHEVDEQIELQRLIEKGNVVGILL